MVANKTDKNNIEKLKPRLKSKFEDEIVSQMVKEYKYRNKLMVPKILKTVSTLKKEYNKLIKYQNEKLQSLLNSETFSSSKEKNYQKIVDSILENIKSLQRSPSVLEELVQKHYVENKKIISLEGNLLRLALNDKISSK